MKIYIIENCKDFASAKSAVLQDYAPEKKLDIVYKATGQPSLYCDGKEYGYISIAHTKNTLAVAFSSQEVGIDIERSDRIVSDRIGITGIEEWTRREAYGKMLGSGITRAMLQCDLPQDKLRTFELGDYFVSVCSDERDYELKSMIDIER